MNSTQRSSFTGRLGFVLAAAGSAVGLGNIWRFPYLAAKYGGGIFLLVYIALSVTFGFSLTVAEIAIGRKTRQSPIGAYRALHRRFAPVGVISAIIPLLVLPYYAVIGGWVIKYALALFTNDNALTQADYFPSYIGTLTEPLLWFFVFLALTAVIVLCGVKKGVEKVSRTVMPVLVVLMLFVTVYALCTVDGAAAGLRYYLKPDLSKFGVKTVVAAMGQLFYSMGLAMGVMITFGSYMGRDVSIERATHQIELFDTGIAVLAGMTIVPACFAFSGGDPEALGAGPGLMFGILPRVFAEMPAGNLIGGVFFLTVLMAALTSSVSMMEVTVSTVRDGCKLSRRACVLAISAVSIPLGLLSCLGYSRWRDVTVLGMQIPELFDFVTNNLMMPAVALATCLMITFFIKPRTVIEEVTRSGHFRQKTLFTAMIRVVAPIFLTVILLWAILGAFTSVPLFAL